MNLIGPGRREVLELVRPYRWSVVVGLFLIAANRLASLVVPASSKYLIDDIINKRDILALGPLVAAVFAAFVVQGATSFTSSLIVARGSERLMADLRRKVQAHIGRLSLSYFDAHKTGVLVSRIMRDVEGIQNLVGTGLIELIGGLFTALFVVVLLIRLSPLLACIELVFLAVFILLLKHSFRTMRPIFREHGNISGQVTGRLIESLGGVRVIKGYHAEAREAEIFSAGVHRLLESVFGILRAESLMGLAATILLGVVSALVMYLGALQVLADTITLGDFFTFTALLAFLMQPVFLVVDVGTQVTEAIAGLDRTCEVLREPPEDADPDRTVAIGPIRGDLTFLDVTFAYKVGSPVLHGISFDSLSGTITALVGTSGSGKSTITGLISAFYKPSSGCILVDGVDLSTVRLDCYRTQIGVVLQETFLFDGSILENVVYGRPNASQEEVLKACQIARVDEFADRFDTRYDTVVGERGVKLSSGQCQRIAIARAIIANPRVLILDEATSNLDSESEAAIQRGLAYLMRGRTTFVIAHRLSTIRRADQILVIEAGRIVERGNHTSLLAEGGRYYTLYTCQHQGGNDSLITVL